MHCERRPRRHGPGGSGGGSLSHFDGRGGAGPQMAGTEGDAYSDGKSYKLMPVVCFQCGMPLNNRQVTFERLLREPGATPKDVFERMGVHSLCCRVNLNTASEDTRLLPREPTRVSFTQPKVYTRGSALVTLRTDGSTDPVNGEPGFIAVEHACSKM